MNNIVIGGAGWTYYETIGGGQGASAAGDGPSGVHVGMSNTLNTPIEALELEYPLRVERYELLDGTGGEGRAPRRRRDRSRGAGARAGEPLAPDRPPAPRTAWLARGRGRPAGGNNLNGEPLPSKVSRELAAEDVVVVRTPGGGGHGIGNHAQL